MWIISLSIIYHLSIYVCLYVFVCEITILSYFYSDTWNELVIFFIFFFLPPEGPSGNSARDVQS